MPPIATRRDPGRSPLGVLATIVRVPLYVVLGGLVVLVLSELPPFAGWLAGIGGEMTHVGLVAGHWQSDSGAVCPDGLQEVDVNLAVARQVAALLREEGHRVEVLPEYAPKLVGYRAAAFVSIHADSCVEGFSGFKVVHHADADPLGPAARLAATLSQAYAEATGLSPHPNTITDDMRHYHALRKIAPDTPGVIIECGFLSGDRDLLTQEQDRVAQGIANGVLAFLQAEEMGRH
jgi:N-acetylmuramoyl-L-alanine amidase